MSAFEKGFTLIELIIVVALISILLALAIPDVASWRHRAIYNNASYQLLAILREARSQSVARKVEHQVEFDVPAGKYRLTRGDRPAKSSNFDTVVQAWTGFSPKVALRANDDCLGTAAVNFTFTPSGTGSSDGTTNDICIMEDPQDGTALIPWYRIGIPSTTSGRATLTKI